MHQAIACALVATPALACITTSNQHVNAQAAADPSMIDADTLAHAFTQHASMSSHGVTGSTPEKKALAVAKSDKPKWDTQKEPFQTFKDAS